MASADIRYKTAHNYDFDNQVRDRTPDRSPSSTLSQEGESDLSYAELRLGVEARYQKGSRWIPGSYVSKSSNRAPNNAVPRRLTLWTNSKKPKESGKWSCAIPRCGRSHERSRAQTPSIVCTCTS
jgi:hypothetical protein